MSCPGRGRAVREICEATGVQDVNLMQQAFYNGHYKNGGKVQHVLQADGMAHSFTCPICNHDASVLCTSSMFLMLPSVYIDGDQNRPAKTGTDKAYGKTPHFGPLHTDTKLRMMGAADRIVAVEFDTKHKKPRLAVENSFNQQTTKFQHCNSFRSHKMTQVHNYLYSCNNSLLINLPVDDNEDNFDVINNFYI
jgi:hypothetical protein